MFSAPDPSDYLESVVQRVIMFLNGACCYRILREYLLIAILASESCGALNSGVSRYSAKHDCVQPSPSELQVQVRSARARVLRKVALQIVSMPIWPAIEANVGHVGEDSKSPDGSPPLQGFTQARCPLRRSRGYSPRVYRGPRSTPTCGKQDGLLSLQRKAPTSTPSSRHQPPSSPPHEPCLLLFRCTTH